jgi:hypothetical protein
MRSDPFWELGSFGITGCHQHNLMNPRKSERLEGARLAFAQGGQRGTRLVYLTPPIRIAKHKNCIEATWAPDEMPFLYPEAPRLASNPETSDFPLLKDSLDGGNRTTMEGKFASKFRARTTCLEDAIAEELIRVYSDMRASVPSAAIAACYTDALPKLPPLVDQHRQHTYSLLLEAASTKSLERELATGYAANAVRNRALGRVIARMDAMVSCGETCPARQKAKRC